MPLEQLVQEMTVAFPEVIFKKTSHLDGSEDIGWHLKPKPKSDDMTNVAPFPRKR
jgi:hypothetical protein